MSTRNRLLLVFGIAFVAAIFLRYVIGGIFAVSSPVVSVKAEPVFSIDGTGFHFGPAMFETASHHPEGFVITNAMLMAVLVTIVLVILSLLATRGIKLAPRGWQNFVEYSFDAMYNTFGSVDRRYITRFWPLVGTIFFYVLISNWLALIPGVLSFGYWIDEATLHGEEAEARVAPNTLLASAGSSDQLAPNAIVTAQEEEEHGQVLVPFFRSPSADLNNTLMLGLVAFCFIEFWGFKELGIGYLRKFWPIKDYGAVGAFVGPLELISEFVRIISFAFRLFGNIFAGEVMILVMLFLFPLLPLPFLALELFVGFIQAFVFAILTMAFSSLATQSHGDHGPDEAGHAEHAEAGSETRQGAAAH